MTFWWCCQRVLRPTSDTLAKVRHRFYHQFKPKDRFNPDFSPGPDPHIVRDVMLYRYEEPLKVFGKNLAGLFMLPLWSYLGYTAYNLKSDLSYHTDEDSAGKSGFLLKIVSKSSTGVGIGFFLFGLMISGYWLNRTMRTVRYIILKKGGKHLTIVTYGQFGPYSRIKTLPTSYVSTVEHPHDGRVFLQVRDERFRYQLDMKTGIINNKPLFDRSLRSK